MIKQHKTLLIDDDTEFCDLLTEYLSGEGFSVTVAHDGQFGAEIALAENFDIIILDVMLPRLGGFDALKKIKAECNTPVLMFTAKGEEIDQVIGLEIGADDYLPKPCSPRLLVARLKAILRRATDNEAAQEDTTIFIADNITIHHDKRFALINETPLELTNSEYNLLLCLVRNKNKVVTKEELCQEGLHRKIEPFDRSVDMHISHLRNKIGKTLSGNPRIRTIRGIGYLLENI